MCIACCIYCTVYLTEFCIDYSLWVCLVRRPNKNRQGTIILRTHRDCPAPSVGHDTVTRYFFNYFVQCLEMNLDTVIGGKYLVTVFCPALHAPLHGDSPYPIQTNRRLRSHKRKRMRGCWAEHFLRAPCVYLGGKVNREL